MGSIYSLIGRTSRQNYHKINKIIEPLTTFCGVDRFWRNAHDTNGAYSLIGNYPPTAEIFFEQELYKGHPYFRHPKFFQSGFAIPGLNKSKEYEATQGRFQTLSGDCYHVFLCIHKHDKGFIEYGFATSKFYPGFEMTYMNHLHSFKKFIDYFEVEGEAIIRQSSKYEINISEIIGTKYHIAPKIAGTTIVPKKELQFLAAIETDFDRGKSILSLTKCERITLGYYLKGGTTKEIALKLHISPRTVEKHLENAKGKLGVTTRSALFDKLILYQELL